MIAKLTRNLALATLAVASTTAAAQTPLALVHGFNSGPETWGTFMAFMAGNTNYTIPSPPTLQSTSGVLNQSYYLNGWIPGEPVLDATMIAVGHSQGGLVSRLTSHYRPMGGILTIGTPNLGVYAADHYATLTEYLVEGAAASGAAYYLSDSYSNPDDPLYDVAGYAMSDASVAWADILVVADVGLDYFFLNGNASVNDLKPGSDILYQLNVSPGSSAELVGTRYAIGCGIPGGYYGGPLILTHSLELADFVGNDLLIWSTELESDAFDVWGNIAWDDPNYTWHQAAGDGLYLESQLVGNFGLFWHYDIVGGIPNDGLIPVSSQIGMPGSFQATCTASHTEETHQISNIFGALQSMTGR